MAKKGVWGVVTFEFDEGDRSGKRVETPNGLYIISSISGGEDSCTIIANRTTGGSMMIRHEGGEGEGDS